MDVHNRARLRAALLTLLWVSPSVFAAGFQVAEHSASGLGRAFSGEAAVAQDASVLSRNPAAITRFDSMMFSGALSVIDPQIDITDTDTGDVVYDVAPMQYVPAAYFTSPINDQWAWGVALFTTYGVGVDYPTDFPAGDISGNTSLASVNLNPSIAYKANDHLSLGAGVNLVYAHAELNRYYGALGGLFGTDADEQLIGLEGTTYSFGWNIGALYEVNDQHRFGVGYRSAVDLDFDDGDFYDGTGDIAPNGATGRLQIELPAILELSGFHQFSELFALHYSWQRTDWSVFKELKATSEDCVEGVCFEKEVHYKDNDRYSIGTTLTFNQHWIARFGYAFDEQAGEPSLSIPDADRQWFSVGGSYVLNQDWSFDLGFTYLVSSDAEFEEAGEIGTYQFSSKGAAYITSLQMNYSF